MNEPHPDGESFRATLVPASSSDKFIYPSGVARFGHATRRFPEMMFEMVLALAPGAS